MSLPARRDVSPHGSQGRPGRRSPIPAQERSQGGDQVQGENTEPRYQSLCRAGGKKKKQNNDKILGQKSLSPSPQDDQTALHISSRLGKVDIVQQLLQCGASANAATTSGYTPLHLAAREGHQDVAAMLLENGASLSSSTKVGLTEDLISVRSRVSHRSITQQTFFIISVPCVSTSGHQFPIASMVLVLEFVAAETKAFIVSSYQTNNLPISSVTYMNVIVFTFRSVVV